MNELNKRKFSEYIESIRLLIADDFPGKKVTVDIQESPWDKGAYAVMANVRGIGGARVTIYGGNEYSDLQIATWLSRKLEEVQKENNECNKENA